MELKIAGLTKQFGDFRAVNHIDASLTCGVYGL